MLDDLSLRVLAQVESDGIDPARIDWLLTYWTSLFGSQLHPAEVTLEPPKGFAFRVYTLALLRFARRHYVQDWLVPANLKATRNYFLESLEQTIHAALANNTEMLSDTSADLVTAAAAPMKDGTTAAGIASAGARAISRA